MKTITYHKSSSGNTVVNHLIYNDDNVSIKSQAALILLNDYLKEMDEDYLKGMYEIQEYLNRRFIFLLKEKRRTGDLVCHYCGKIHLEVGYRLINQSALNNKNKMLATVDHVIPMSSGKVNLLDEKNWVVSCKKCNSRKGSKSYEEFKFKK